MEDRMSAHVNHWVVLGVLSIAVPAGSAPEERVAPDKDECPSSIRGVELKLAKARGGVVLEFRAPSTLQVADLRTLIGEAGAYVEFVTKVAALRSEQVLAYDGTPVPPVDVSVKSIPTGARVTVRADRPQDTTAVIEQAKTLKRYWDENPCMAGGTSSELVMQPFTKPNVDDRRR
jgi:hypothetical protein